MRLVERRPAFLVELAVEAGKHQAAWQALMRKNMALDFSWDTVAPKYLELYQRARDKRRSLLEG